MLNLHPQTWFSFLPGEWVVFFISMLPVSELRGAIPVGLEVYNISPVLNALIAIAGNMTPIVFILLLLPKLHNWLLQQKFLGSVFRKKLKQAESKFQGRYYKYGAAGLILFVATPLPFTGAWTGSLAAFVFDIEFKRSFPLIFAGVCISSVLVTLITLGADNGLRFIF